MPSSTPCSAASRRLPGGGGIAPEWSCIPENFGAFSPRDVRTFTFLPANGLVFRIEPPQVSEQKATEIWVCPCLRVPSFGGGLMERNPEKDQHLSLAYSLRGLKCWCRADGPIFLPANHSCICLHGVLRESGPLIEEGKVRGHESHLKGCTCPYQSAALLFRAYCANCGELLAFSGDAFNPRCFPQRFSEPP